MKKLKKIFLFLLLCVTFNSNAQYLTGINNRMLRDISNTMADAYLLKHIKNVSEIIKYNEQLYSKSQQRRLLFNVDTTLSIVADSSIYLIKGHICSTNYNVLFAFDLQNFDFFILNHGYECCEKTNFKSIRKLIKLTKDMSLVNYKEREHLMLDIISPSYYSYYKISNDSLICYPRFLSDIGNKNDLFAKKINSIKINKTKHKKYLICDSSYEKFFFVGINKTNIKFPINIDKENIFGDTDYFVGPKVIF